MDHEIGNEKTFVTYSRKISIQSNIPGTPRRYFFKKLAISAGSSSIRFNLWPKKLAIGKNYQQNWAMEKKGVRRNYWKKKIITTNANGK
jgi:hypothetical protein